MPSMDQQSFISGVERSEVDEVLCGFHDDSHLLPFDIIFQNETDSLMFSATPANGDQQSFFCGAEHSEVDEDLFGFLDAHFLPFDTIFQNDTDSLMFSASPANGDQQSFSCGVEHSEVDEALFGFHDDSYPLPFDTIFQNEKDSLMFSAPPANGEGLNNFCLPSPDRIHEQPPPVYEQSSFFYPLDPAMAVAAAAGGGGCMSAQSVAARQRRKRISEKTQELGRLIPGGMGMNTAQMLQAAFKYVKFLQAQFGLMASFPECKIAKEEDLQVLVASPAIQEKLAAEGMCVVPTEMVDGLATGIEFKSEPLISSVMDPSISEPLISSAMDPFISEPLI